MRSEPCSSYCLQPPLLPPTEQEVSATERSGDQKNRPPGNLRAEAEASREQSGLARRLSLWRRLIATGTRDATQSRA
jgi:hypothetical protein